MLKLLFKIAPLILVLFVVCFKAQAAWKSSFPPLAIDIDQEIVSAFAAKFGAKVKGSKIPFARRLQQLKTGEIDLLAGLLKNSNREEFTFFLSTPYKKKTNKIFLMRKGEGQQLQKYEDLYNLRVGVQVGSNYFPRFDTDPKIRKFASTDNESRIHMLLKNRFDVLIHTEIYCKHLVYKMGLQEKVEVAPYAYTEYNPVYIGISKKSYLYQKRDELDAVFSRMVESGEIDRLIQSYFKTIGLPIPE